MTVNVREQPEPARNYGVVPTAGAVDRTGPVIGRLA
jgi:hypothetical protein